MCWAAWPLLLGAAAALDYARAGLSLSHYDAKAHLVVARRILDSITPGWEQIGAVWLPLPHVLNMLPVQVDVLLPHGRLCHRHLHRVARRSAPPASPRS